MKVYIPIVFLLTSLFITQLGISQSEVKIEQIPVGVFIPEQPNIESISTFQLLKSKLQRSLTVAGIGGQGGTNDLILYPIVNFVTEEITAGAPVMYIQNQDVSIFLSTWDGSKVFGSCALNLKGAGTSREKAFINAIKGLNVRDKNLQEMLKKSKKKMVKYFSENCDVFLAQASSLANQSKFGEAISLLHNYPSLNEECYFKSRNMASEIYQQMEQRACDNYLSKAKAAFANHQFDQATYFLMQIPPATSCETEVAALLAGLKTETEIIDERSWEFLNRVHSDAAMLESERISAIANVFSAILSEERNESVQDIIINKFDFDD